MEELAAVLISLLLVFALIGTALTGVAVKRDLWDAHHPKVTSKRHG